MRRIVVRYRPTSEHADDNQSLVEGVFAELAGSQPDGFRYATWRLADDSFIHIAEFDGEENPLAASAAFAQFQERIGERCEGGEPPDAQPATLVGNYRLVDPAS